jgi:hypothetical protein
MTYGQPQPYTAPPGGAYPSTAFPQQAPPVMFPNGMPWTGAAVPAPSIRPTRLIQGVRLRYGWLYGDNDPRELQIHEIDTSVPVALPNFLFTGQPIYIAPSFSLQLWDGPPAVLPADLPSKTYSAFLDTGWKSDLEKRIGGELGVRAGVFTDFDTLTTDSLRVQGVGLMRMNVTSTVTIRAGVMYVDRLDVKLIPAGGILWEPNAQTRWDIFFPEPKFSQYLTTLGNSDIWWYIAGEWGGDTWTIKRDAGFTDRFEYKDLRVMGGIEWGSCDLIQQGRRFGFIEAGWVLDRSVIYYERPGIDNFTMRDTFIIRGGIGY